MKHLITRLDILALALPAMAAVAGMAHFVYIDDDNPAQFLPFFALYAGGYLLWGAVARTVGSASVAAATATLFVLGGFFSVSAAIGWLIVPAVAVPSLGGLLAAGAWGTRRRGERPAASPSHGRSPATGADAAAILVPAILTAAAVIAYVNIGDGPFVALRPWAVVLEYIAYLGGYGFWRLQRRGYARRIFMPCVLIAMLGVLFGATSILGILIMLFVGMPAAGAAVAGMLALLESAGSEDAPRPVAG